jgi:hypothetical protein
MHDTRTYTYTNTPHTTRAHNLLACIHQAAEPLPSVGTDNAHPKPTQACKFERGVGHKYGHI